MVKNASTTVVCIGHQNDKNIGNLLVAYGVRGAYMEERIKSIYNECWKIYKQYLETRDMAEWNRNMLQVKEKYGGKPDVVNLLLWHSINVQALHDQSRRA